MNFFVTDSNLETFPPSEAQGKISGGSRPPRDADGTCYSILYRLDRFYAIKSMYMLES